MDNNPKTIFDTFHATCLKFPHNTALIFKQDNRFVSLSYRDLLHEILQIAALLHHRGIARYDKVAIILENTPLWLKSYLAISRLSAIAVPLYPQIELEELIHFLKHSNTKLVITSSQIMPLIQESIQSHEITMIALDKELLNKEKDSPLAETLGPLEADPNDIASIVYTSGTTSTPKGVVLTHTNFLSNIQAIRSLNIVTEDDCFIALLPYHHTYPFTVNFLLPLSIGAKISFPDKLEGEQILECIKQTGVTIMVAVPRLLTLFYNKITKTLQSLPPFKKVLVAHLLRFALYMRKKRSKNIAKKILKDLHNKFGPQFRFIVSGGSKLPLEVANSFYSWGFTILEGYGLTEAAPIITFNLPHDFKIGSIGKPIPGVNVHIYAPDPHGIGEIVAKGPNITPGYYNDPDTTNSTIKEGWLYTGDLGFIDKNGFITIEGRKKEMIVLSSGKNIFPDEIENFYLKSPFIEEICVFLSQASDDKNKDVLAAAILPNHAHFRETEISQTKDRIRWEIETLSSKLPSYKRIKKYIIINEHLPRTILGKLKRYEIEQTLSQHVSHVKTSTKITTQDLPLLNSPICKKSLEYLNTKLNRSVNLDDHLELDLGLDSLEQIELLLNFEKQTGVEISTDENLSIFTVRDLLQKLYNASGEESDTSFQCPVEWETILRHPPPQEILETISLTQSVPEKLISMIFTLLLLGLARIFFLLKIHNKHNAHLKGPAIYIPNHASFLDGFIVAAAIGPRFINDVYFLGYSMYFKHFLVAWSTKICRFISINASSHLIESLQASSYVLQSGKKMCIFPEGVRSIDGKIKDFKKGVAILMKELKVPLIPVYLKGTHQAWPRGKRFPKPAKIEVIFGDKILPEEIIPTDQSAGNEDIYQIISERLKEKLIELSKKI